MCVAEARPADAAGTPIKVSCVGDQTTHSDLFPDTNDQPVGMQEYPAMLQTLLGSGYDVSNFGDCCSSVIMGYPASETHPYIDSNHFAPSIAFAPDIVIIGSWGRHDWGMSAKTALATFEAGDTATDFTLWQTDYDILVSKYIAAASKPKIFCCTPIPIPFGNDGPDNGYKTSPAAAAVKAVCGKYNLPIIDLFTAFTGQKPWFINPPLADSEGEHVSPAGSMEFAQLVYDAIMGVDSGVLIPAGGGDGGPNDSDASSGGSGGEDAGVSGGGGSSGGGAGSTSSSGGTVGGVGGGSSGSVGSSGAAAGSGTTGTTAGASSSGGGTTGTSSGAASGGPAGSNAAGAGSSGDQSGGETSEQSSSSKGCSVASSGPGEPSPWGCAVLGAVGWALVARKRRAGGGTSA
jgi:hypothetical protein